MYVANRGNEWKYVNLTAAYFRFQVISPLRLPPQGWVINSFFLEYSEGCLVPDHFFRLNNWLVKAKRWEYLLTLLRAMCSKGLVLDVCLFNSLVRMFCWEGYCKSETFYEVSLILDSMLECLSSKQHKSASDVTV